MYVIIGCSSRDEKRLLSLFYLEGFYDATQVASLPSLWPHHAMMTLPTSLIARAREPPKVGVTGPRT
jgi:hypothetical protein